MEMAAGMTYAADRGRFQIVELAISLEDRMHGDNPASLAAGCSRTHVLFDLIILLAAVLVLSC